MYKNDYSKRFPENHTKYPLIELWVNELLYFQTMEYYITKEMNKLLLHEVTQMNLKNVTNSNHLSPILKVDTKD